MMRKSFYKLMRVAGIEYEKGRIIHFKYYVTILLRTSSNPLNPSHHSAPSLMSHGILIWYMILMLFHSDT